MARVVGKARPRQEGVGTSMKLSETGIFIVIGIIGILALKWYFVDYRHSPGYALGTFIGAIKSGNVEAQYAMLDAKDKETVPTQKKYESACQWARGYTERITGTNFTNPVPDAKDPSIVTINATLAVRGQAGKNLTETGDSSSVNCKFALRKDKEGAWKVLASQSDLRELLKLPANPPGDSF